MRKFIVSREVTNKLLAYAAIVVIIVESILVYTYNFSLSESMITFGFAAAMFAIPLIVYFIKPGSALFKYLFVFFAITYMFFILYIQKGNIDNIFLLYVVLASASLYFDVEFTLYTTAVLCTETTLGFIFFREQLYPLLVPTSVMSLIFNFLVIGVLLAFQGEWGKRMMNSYESAYARSITDPLTQIHNRAFFDEYLRDTVEHARKYGEPFCVAILDIDDFKVFNDTYGHPVGDLVLKTTVRVIHESIRKTDILCRFGGEEFTLIFQATPLADARVITEKIRSCVEKNVLENDGKDLHLTISMGVTEFALRDDAASIVERADHALLKAKKKGKNRVESV
ncbi:MAG: GGDEF domain-containing protein [Spirochaetes bacterium]|nr:GGDEF domain-containing protein [Spirochaetota bacterium]